MKKLVVFGASSSKASINEQLAVWAAQQVEDAEVKVLKLSDYEMPIYSIDKEVASGIPQEAKDFIEEINNADGVVISFAEHNGNFTAAYKNIFDWASRATRSVYNDKPVFVMATSPGPRGGLGVLGIASASLPYAGAKVTGNFSLPTFQDNFSEGITNEELKEKFESSFSLFKDVLNETTVKA
ncbi:NADPH-dependent FMN reductase [Flammeovirga agarivorans]|uniref:NAD(P)H-dependent oxidoreductase n=1 Tax=Flammeovirga agarivorans TaxID=2726742 RepID=A0A7X8SHB9_9BACT|nr:NAD(P)H-dependent oxidoreductase [Flammeovirga agarivorans]NLR90234.1 NAD(P)H-dependent oxidoreductase [Flammeovirga agarivorans]